MQATKTVKWGVGLVLLTVIFFGIWQFKSQPQPGSSETVILPIEPPKGIEAEAQLSISQDKLDLFRRLLWRAPEATDEIREAEYRTWDTEKDGLRAWQGFMQIRPGEILENYLAGNPFRLKPITAAELPKFLDQAPQWLPDFTQSATYTLQGRSDGMLYIIKETEGNTYYIIGKGFGFKARSE